MVAIDENPVAAGRRKARALARHSAGRQISDTVTTLGANVDGSVRRIDTTYNAQGLAYQLTSYADTAGTQIVNQVENIYNGLGQLAFQYEALTGAVDLATTPVVQYTYTTLGTGSLPSSMVYPNGRTITYSYGSGLSNTNAPLDQAIGRLDAIVDGAGSGDAGKVLEQYSYLGLSTIVARNHPQTGINLTLLGASGAIGSGGDQYVGLDRFGRVVDQNWVNAAGTTVDGYTYSYDGDSNVTAKNNTLDSAYSQGFTYDPLNRLTAATQGGSAYQSWNLDSRGNWSSFTSGTTTQTESANAQNQITSISGSATPTYDANGNMTSDQNGNTYVYDAWNRLVEVKNAAGTVITQYSYDARGYRITESYPQGGNGVAAGTTNYIYYDANWQAIETRTNGTAASNVTSQMVWSAAYINAAVLQDSYSGGVIQPNSRLYFTQDANWDTTAVVGYDSTAQTWGVVQRYVYSPYGNITVLNADWSTPPAGTQPLVNNLYQGMTLDAVTGLYYERLRNYSPTLGRWTSQDPLGYINGANTYQFVDSSPVGNVDAGGSKAWAGPPHGNADGSWQIRRSPSGAYAIATALRNHASVKDLARLAGMSPYQVKLWMLPPKKSSNVCKGDKFRVPNTVYIDVGDINFDIPHVHVGNPFLALNVKIIVMRMQSMFHSEGFNVVTYGHGTRLAVDASVESPDAYGFVFIGHGNKFGGYVFPANYDGGKHHEVTSLPVNHQLGLVVMLACYAGRNAFWQDAVSPNGEYRATNHELTLSPWDTVNSVPER